jgi:hypothetical protein
MNTLNLEIRDNQVWHLHCLNKLQVGRALESRPERSEIILGNVHLLRFRAWLPEKECLDLGNRPSKRIIKAPGIICFSGGNDA